MALKTMMALKMMRIMMATRVTIEPFKMFCIMFFTVYLVACKGVQSLRESNNVDGGFRVCSLWFRDGPFKDDLLDDHFAGRMC